MLSSRVGYRDEQEALRAKVDHLERELDEARREIDRLRGEPSTDSGSGKTAGPGAFWLGAPTRLRFRRSLDGELRADDHEAIVEGLQELFDAEGSVSVFGSTFRWSLRPPAINRVVDVRIKSKDGRTTIQITERLGNLAGGLFGGIVGGVGGGGVAGVAMAAAALAGAWAAPLAGVLWIVGTYGAVRTGYHALVKRRAAQLVRAAEQLEAAVRSGALGGAVDGAPRARVEATQGDEPARDDMSTQEAEIEIEIDRGPGRRSERTS